MADDRQLVLRGVFEQGTPGSGIVFSNTPGAPRRAKILLCDSQIVGSKPVFNGSNLLTRKFAGKRDPLPGEDLGFSLPGPAAGLVKIEQPAPAFDQRTRAQQFLGYGFSMFEGTTGQTIVAVGTHTLTIDRGAGGAISSWDAAGVELLAFNNRMQGLQMAMEWTDDASGELVRHQPSMADVEGFGAPFVSITLTQQSAGGTIIDIDCIPIDSDPRGSLAIPGVRSDHGGRSTATPAIWKDIRYRMSIWINYRGTVDLHRITSQVTFPYAIATGFFDVALYLIGFLSTSQFPELWAYDTSLDVETQISSGTTGVPGYQAEWRRYTQDDTILQGDDETASSTSSLLSGYGGVGGRGVLASAPAALFAGRYSPDDTTETEKELTDYSRGNAHTWMQNRASGTFGNALAIAPGAYLTGRIHPLESRRSIVAGLLSVETFLITDTWDNAKVLAALIP